MATPLTVVKASIGWKGGRLAAMGMWRGRSPAPQSRKLGRYYRWITFLFLPVQHAGFVLVFWTIAGGDPSTVDKIGLAVSIGCVGGIGIDTAHEPGHRAVRVEAIAARDERPRGLSTA